MKIHSASFMALTKKDLGSIRQLFREEFSEQFGHHFANHFALAFEQNIVPYVDATVQASEGRMIKRMDELYLSLKEDITENTKLIRHYFQSLDQRVTVLEAKC